MYTNYVHFADQALYDSLTTVMDNGFAADSRNGPVLRLPRPLATVYMMPRKRVLYNAVRDCNPFMHLFEAMWMLAGREDVAFVSYFTPSMVNYSDDGKTLRGAYGYRWRQWFGVDQIDEYVIPTLLKDADSRQAYISMWDPATDLLDEYNQPLQTRDRCCNVGIAFDVVGSALNMTVFNRSNDIVWGLAGANLVHMSFLLEYVALAIGKNVGTYTQVSNNAHLYLENPVTKRLVRKNLAPMRAYPDSYVFTEEYNLRQFIPRNSTVSPYLFNSKEEKHVFDEDLRKMLTAFDLNGNLLSAEYTTLFGKMVLKPLGDAWELYKENNLVDALNVLAKSVQCDWVINAMQWLHRRLDGRITKELAI
jgi:hypothetical protein